MEHLGFTILKRGPRVIRVMNNNNIWVLTLCKVCCICYVVSSTKFTDEEIKIQVTWVTLQDHSARKRHSRDLNPGHLARDLGWCSARVISSNSHSSPLHPQPGRWCWWGWWVFSNPLPAPQSPMTVYLWPPWASSLTFIASSLNPLAQPTFKFFSVSRLDHMEEK